MSLLHVYLPAGTTVQVACREASIQRVWLIAIGENGKEAARFKIDQISGYKIEDGVVEDDYDPMHFKAETAPLLVRDGTLVKGGLPSSAL